MDEDEDPAPKKPDAKEAGDSEGSVDPEEEEREKLMRQLKHKEGKKKRNRSWADSNQDSKKVTRKSQSFEPPRRPRIPRRP